MSDQTYDVVERVEYTENGDSVVQWLRWAILIVVISIIALAAFAAISGVFTPAAPRTQAESVLLRAKAAVKVSPGSGQAWAQLARAQYLTGDKGRAYDSIAQARKRVKDETILWVNNQEVDMLIRDGKNAEALKKTDTYIQKDVDLRIVADAANKAKGISPPLETQDQRNQTTIQLFLMRATAEMNLKKYKDAVVSYTNALKMTPNAADVLTYRGLAQLKAGDKKGAKADFEQALTYMPDYTPAQAGLKAAGGK
ncbi:MAG TPA: tetratricopeptide repeat protein [Coriobacteriia bacterium]|nr:tetratricopeptide repeat protein [Coriobacteriia bacterium]